MLHVFGFASPTTAGAASSFRVTATDMFGNRVSSYRGTIHFTSSDLQGLLPADYTFTAADNGTHTFMATLRTAGFQTITATDTVTSSVIGTQKHINVGSAAAVTLLVSGFPATIAAGMPGMLKVTALDAFGNVARGYRGTVHFTSSDSAAGLPADFTFTRDNAGLHTFTVVLKSKGPQSITASDTVTGSITGSESGIMVTSAGIVPEEEDPGDGNEPEPAAELLSARDATDMLMASLDQEDLELSVNAQIARSFLSAVAMVALSSFDRSPRRRGIKSSGQVSFAGLQCLA
jgi:hypothetical protein